MLPSHGVVGLFCVRPALTWDSLSTRTIGPTSSLPSLTARLSHHPLSLSFFLGRLSRGLLPQPGPRHLHLPGGEHIHAVQPPAKPFQRRKKWPHLPRHADRLRRHQRGRPHRREEQGIWSVSA
uniref:Uncharacterized protein n=1 Tax=Rousettus aegyptiacus TaxID=9407 RepID=A0A7J8BDZ1_ROUAE|nr:hypothetical protein HJG63_009715 [Rousettus aegyptiacus]